MANSQDLKMDTASTTSQDSFQIVDGALDRADCTANKTTSTDTVDLIKFSASEESPSDIETFLHDAVVGYLNRRASQGNNVETNKNREMLDDKVEYFKKQALPMWMSEIRALDKRVKHRSDDVPGQKHHLAPCLLCEVKGRLSHWAWYAGLSLLAVLALLLQWQRGTATSAATTIAPVSPNSSSSGTPSPQDPGVSWLEKNKRGAGIQAGTDLTIWYTTRTLSGAWSSSPTMATTRCSTGRPLARDAPAATHCHMESTWSSTWTVELVPTRWMMGDNAAKTEQVVTVLNTVVESGDVCLPSTK